ncbi:unnamed protein product [Thlaspi arvense]|uniref:Uncharacterized protein n=1 Tax=Thlaspi arvense TaxID=13288 RepID=A0AAU9R8V4_THLAR|nr:unnamed protein product [Thlaspi arvense]
MDDSSTPRTRFVSRRLDPVKLSPMGTISSRRSFSFSTSSILFTDDSSGTPLRLLGVPFSWEKLPGEPKELSYHRKTESANNLLPLPPHRNNCLPAAGKHFSLNTTRKKNTPSTVMRDPFTAALVECSRCGGVEEGKHTGGESNKALRKNSIRLVNLYASCKRACDVSESIIYLPRSVAGVASYDHLLSSTRRRRR